MPAGRRMTRSFSAASKAQTRIATATRTTRWGRAQRAGGFGARCCGRSGRRRRRRRRQNENRDRRRRPRVPGGRGPSQETGRRWRVAVRSAGQRRRACGRDQEPPGRGPAAQRKATSINGGGLRQWRLRRRPAMLRPPTDRATQAGAGAEELVDLPTTSMPADPQANWPPAEEPCGRRLQ